MPEEEKDTSTEDDDEPQLDPDDPGEVGFAGPTKGAGWSGRDKE
ncbi:MAG TPA: hypothetical protein VG078_12315 [Acidimicrobiales bacterium]|nr:hypothetical protein [Acidimicrobiales bacterium]